MSMKPFMTMISRHVRKLMWINALLFTLPVHAILLRQDQSGLGIALMIVLWTFLLGVGNHLVMKHYFLRRVVADCRLQMRTLRNDLSYDELTGVYSRRAGMARLAEEFSRSRRYGAVFSVAMIDVDHFKRVNDLHGHLVGDQVLRQIALRLRKDLRDCDIVVRYGGEEFLLILPETELRNALVPLERIRRTVSRELVHVGDVGVAVSVSIGVTTAFPLEEDLSEAVRRADEALYTAKKAGRDRVVPLAPVPGFAPQPAHAQAV